MFEVGLGHHHHHEAVQAHPWIARPTGGPTERVQVFGFVPGVATDAEPVLHHKAAFVRRGGQAEALLGVLPTAVEVLMRERMLVAVLRGMCELVGIVQVV